MPIPNRLFRVSIDRASKIPAEKLIVVFRNSHKTVAMFNLRIIVIPAMALACVNALAQTPEITVDSRASSNDIQTWLSSGDPRLIAWARTSPA